MRFNPSAPLIHATCIALDGQGVMLRGPSGSGKSSLALCLIDQGAQLVGDDYCAYAAHDGQLWAAPQKTLEGLLEVRGMGLISMPFLPKVPIVVVIDLLPPSAPQPDRLPDPQQDNILGVYVPVFPMNAFSFETCAKVRLAVRLVTGNIGAAS